MELLWASGWVKCLPVCLKRYYWGRTRTQSFCSRPSSGWKGAVGGSALKCSGEGLLSLFVWERQFLNQHLFIKKVRMRMLDSQAEHLKLHSIRVQCRDLTPFQGWDLGNHLLLGISKSEIFLRRCQHNASKFQTLEHLRFQLSGLWMLN